MNFWLSRTHFCQMTTSESIPETSQIRRPNDVNYGLNHVCVIYIYLFTTVFSLSFITYTDLCSNDEKRKDREYFSFTEFKFRNIYKSIMAHNRVKTIKLVFFDKTPLFYCNRYGRILKLTLIDLLFKIFFWFFGGELFINQ